MALSKEQRAIEQRKYTEGTWQDLPNFVCCLCPFATLNQTNMVLHVRHRHRDQEYRLETPVSTEVAAVAAKDAEDELPADPPPDEGETEDDEGKAS